MIFAVPADHRVKQKESQKRNKYVDLGRELTKLWNMKVTVIATVIAALSSITKGLVLEIEDLQIREKFENIQTTAISEISQNTKESAGGLW